MYSIYYCRKPHPNGPPFGPIGDINHHLYDHQYNKNVVPILATFDALAVLTTKRPSVTLPDLPTYPDKSKIPPSVKSYSFVRLYKQNHVPTSVKPWPPIASTKTTVTPKTPPTPPTFDLFSPADTYLNSGEFYPDHKWDVKMEIPDGLRDLLKAEREKLRNISFSIGFDLRDHKIWPITRSRAAHRDSDVFIGRANNPFGHSTRWKWR